MSPAEDKSAVVRGRRDTRLFSSARADRRTPLVMRGAGEAAGAPGTCVAGGRVRSQRGAGDAGHLSD